MNGLHAPIDFVRLSSGQQRRDFCIGLLASRLPSSFSSGRGGLTHLSLLAESRDHRLDGTGRGEMQREREMRPTTTRARPFLWPANGSPSKSAPSAGNGAAAHRRAARGNAARPGGGQRGSCERVAAHAVVEEMRPPTQPPRSRPSARSRRAASSLPTASRGPSPLVTCRRLREASVGPRPSAAPLARGVGVMARVVTSGSLSVSNPRLTMPRPD